MAHIQKYKAHSCGHMLAHYRRDESSLGRDNIDQTLTHLNRTLELGEDGRAVDGDAKPSWAVIEERISSVDAAAKRDGKRITRKDAVVMADLVLTLPENVPEVDGDRFFELSYEFFAGKVGADNLLGGFVHRDEVRTKKDAETGEVVRTGERVRDHIHVPWTPILDGRFSFKRQCPRTFYKTLHKELGDYLEDRLGYRPDIELSEEQKGDKALSQVQNADIDATRDAIKRKEERLECLRRDEAAEEAEIADLDRAIEQAESQPPAQSVFESARTLWTARGDGEREEALTGDIERLRERIGELERSNQGARERVADLDRALPGLRGRCRDLRARFEDAQLRVREVIGRLREVPETVSAWALDIARKMVGVRTYDPNSFEYRARMAQRSAGAWNEERLRRPGRERGRGIDR